MAMTIKAGPVAKYQQLTDALKDQIERGEYRIGERICTEAELVRDFDVSSTTAVRALRELEQQGLVTRRRGKGTFLRQRQVTSSQWQQPRTLLLHGRSTFGPTMLRTSGSVNWFIGYEIHRGVINSYDGPVRLVQRDDFHAVFDQLEPEQMCVIAVDPSEEERELLGSDDVPYVVIDRETRFARPEANTVAYDRLKGVYDGMHYLIDELGHRNIAMISSQRRRHPERMAGYVAALESADISFRSELVVRAPGAGAIETGAEAMQTLLRSGETFTAVFVDTDTKAIGAIEALQEAGMRVPEDVSVLGYDDIPNAAELEPALTTVHMPNHEIGVEAVRLLRERIMSNGEDAPGSVLATHLIKRETCAPASPPATNS